MKGKEEQSNLGLGKNKKNPLGSAWMELAEHSHKTWPGLCCTQWNQQILNVSKEEKARLEFLKSV